jgi:predicted GTPase
MSDKTGLDQIETVILNADIEESEKSKILKILLSHKNNKSNILITGATGCGKSSTIPQQMDLTYILC